MCTPVQVIYNNGFDWGMRANVTLESAKSKMNRNIDFTKSFIFFDLHVDASLLAGLGLGCGLTQGGEATSLFDLLLTLLFGLLQTHKKEISMVNFPFIHTD